MRNSTYILISLLLIPSILFGQHAINGKVIDNETNKPVPYVNIWIKNTNIGTTSSFSGVFNINNYNFSDTCKIVLSSIGYKDTIIIINDLKAEIRLLPTDYQLEEITVYPQKRKELIVNDLSNKKIEGGIMNDTTPQIIGRYFPYQSDYYNYPYIKKIIIYSRDTNRGKLNLRLYSFDTTKVEPINTLINENIIITTKLSLFARPKPTIIDLSKYAIEFPEKGILVGVEWLIIPENRYKVTYSYNDSKKKKVKTMYAPNLGATIEQTGFMYQYKKGVWWKPIKTGKIPGYKYSELYFNPAISLILTD